MRPRITLACSLLRLSALRHDLPVVVMRPADMGEWARVKYDRNSATWNTLNNPDAGLTQEEQTQWERVSQRAGRMLILGGGRGREAVFFVRQGWQVTALDISAGMLAQASAVMQTRGLDLQTVQGDLATFTAPAQSFDAVWTSMFLYSLVLGRAAHRDA